MTSQQYRKAASILYAQILADDELSRFFDGVDVPSLQQRQARFLCHAIQGTPGESYEPSQLRAVHAPLLAQGLNHWHFDRMLAHLQAALQEAGVTEAEQRSALERVAALRRAVLGETYTYEKQKEKTMLTRMISMTYAVVSYAAGMGVLLYSALWLGGFGLPQVLDSPARFSVTALLINLALVLGFGLQHSVMARPAFKQWWTRIIPAHAERATYVLASSIAMFAMMWFWQPLGVDIWRLEGDGRLALYGLFGLGWFVLVSSTFWLNHFDLFGLRQAWLNLRGKAYSHIPFRTPGYYRWVRHPIYVGWLLVIWATPTMTVSHLVFALATTAYILIAIPMEERDLEELLPEYGEYKRTTPALLPGA